MSYILSARTMRASLRRDNMQTPHRIATDKAQGLEVWTTWDEGAEVYELWASDECSDYIGCAGTRAEALHIARDWFADRASY